MILRAARCATILGLACLTGAAAAGCSASSGKPGSSTQGTGAATGSTGTGASHAASSGSATGTGTGATGTGGVTSFVGSSTGTGGTTGQTFDVEPTPLQTITVPAGQTMPTVTYTATSNKSPINVGWGVDKGNVGTIPAGPSSTGVFAPSGTAGGLVTVSASLNKQTVTRQVMVKLTAQQNGPNTSPGEQAQIAGNAGQLTAGGGVGGVGGEGLGGAVIDVPTLSALGSPTGSGAAQALGFVYPYDRTVWPRGLLAPLLMWTWSVGDADAIQIGLQTKSGSFSWTGTFGRPAVLTQTGGKFIRHPIPQDVWDMATNSAGGQADPLTVSLTVAKGGMAYGPIQETWTIAQARLSGTIYYNSYGTNYTQNSGTGISVGTNQAFGGAVLSIRVGDTAPKLAAGTSSAGTQNGCRVCHSVAANGSRLVVQQGQDYTISSSYDIATNGLTEHMMSNGSRYPGMYPDGSLALMEGAMLLPLPSGTPPVATTGLSSQATDLGTPAFSPDGKKVVFNPQTGNLTTGYTLYAMSYDATTHAFSGPTLIASDLANAGLGYQPGWPAFFPDSSSVVYHHQTVASQDRFDVFPTLYTRAGSDAQIYWTNLTDPSAVTPLDALNGKGYLPKLATPSTLSCMADSQQMGGGPPDPFYGGINDPDLDHSDDVDHNYEPTVAPVASGGYAWVVFTSRRMYGSVATIPPFCSDPRGVDLIKNVTTKKLWVAAVDLNQAPGTDSSHPAFYLPAQEILAGNSRGFWVLDPCKADGMSCMTGDQCCNGYCEPNGAMGALVCSTMPPGSTCSGVGDKCTTSADCCNPTVACIGGFCALKSPP